MKRPRTVTEKRGTGIVVYPRLVSVLGNMNHVAVLGQLERQSERFADADGWFYYPSKELQRDTGLGKDPILYSRERLRELKILEERRDRLRHFTWYRLDFVRYEELLNEVEPIERSPQVGVENSVSGDVDPRLARRESASRETQRPVSYRGIENIRGEENDKGVRYNRRTSRCSDEVRSNGRDHPRFRRTIPPDEDPSEGSRRPSISTRTESFLPIVDGLADLVRTQHRTRVPPRRRLKWARSCRLLAEEDGVDFDRQQNVLREYAKIYGNEWVPVVESGSAWREKFIKVEEAIKRSRNGNGRRRRGLGSGTRVPERHQYKQGKDEVT